MRSSAKPAHQASGAAKRLQKRRKAAAKATTELSSIAMRTAGAEYGFHDHYACAVSATVKQIAPARTAELTDAARWMKQQGEDVIELAAGEPDFATPQAVVDAAIEAINEGDTGYAPNQGRHDLRQAICTKLLVDNGVRYTPEQIVVSNGAKQSVAQAIIATCGSGDEVIIPAPHWVSYPEMVRLAGATPVVQPTSLENGLKITPAELQQCISQRTRLIVLVSPSNPTGKVYSRAELEQLKQVLQQYPRVAVLADEIYEHVVHPEASHTCIASLDGMQQRTLLVNGFSKAYSMTGWRLGYLAAPTAELAQAVSALQSQLTSGACNFTQRAGITALSLGTAASSPVTQMVNAFTQRRDALLKELRKIPRLSVSRPEGAFYLWLDASALVGEGVHAEGYGEVKTDEALCDYLLKVGQVCLVPGSAFGQGPALRLSYAASMDSLMSAAQRMQDALSAERIH